MRASSGYITPLSKKKKKKKKLFKDYQQSLSTTFCYLPIIRIRKKETIMKKKWKSKIKCQQ